MWEVPIKKASMELLKGITPTYVGSTFTLFIFKFNIKDHPHVCGKYVL